MLKKQICIHLHDFILERLGIEKKSAQNAIFLSIVAYHMISSISIEDRGLVYIREKREVINIIINYLPSVNWSVQ